MHVCMGGGGACHCVRFMLSVHAPSQVVLAVQPQGTALCFLRITTLCLRTMPVLFGLYVEVAPTELCLPLAHHMMRLPARSAAALLPHALQAERQLNKFKGLVLMLWLDGLHDDDALEASQATCLINTLCHVMTSTP